MHKNPCTMVLCKSCEVRSTAGQGRTLTKSPRSALTAREKAAEATGSGTSGARCAELRLAPDVLPASADEFGACGKKASGSEKEKHVSMYTDPMFIRAEIDRRLELSGVEDEPHPHRLAGPRPGRPLARPADRRSSHALAATPRRAPVAATCRPPAPPVTHGDLGPAVP